MLRQLLRHAADPNQSYDSLRKETIWEAFLSRLECLGDSSVNDCHANLIEEFLRHGADPFVSNLDFACRSRLVVLIESHFSYEISRRLQNILSQEKDHQRMRSVPLRGSLTLSTKQEALASGEARIAPKRPCAAISGSAMRSQEEPFKRMRSGESRANPVVID